MEELTDMDLVTLVGATIKAVRYDDSVCSVEIDLEDGRTLRVKHPYSDNEWADLQIVARVS